MQIEQRVHLPMKYVIKKEFGKHSYSDSLSPKIKPSYNSLQNIT